MRVGKRFQIQQLRPVGIRQRRFRGAPGARDRRRAHLIGRDRLADAAISAASGLAAERTRMRQRAGDRIHFGRRQQIRSRHAHRPPRWNRITCEARSGFATRYSARDTSLAVRRFQRRLRHQVLRITHVHADPVHLRARHRPESRRACRQHHLRHQIAPDQRLRLRRNQEILFGFGQRIRQTGQRPDQPPAGVRRPAACRRPPSSASVIGIPRCR